MSIYELPAHRGGNIQFKKRCCSENMKFPVEVDKADLQRILGDNGSFRRIRAKIPAGSIHPWVGCNEGSLEYMN
jgi:hypothetical protein